MTLKLISYLVVFAYFFLVFIGLLSFELWPQVEYINSVAENVSLLSLIGNYHFPRYLVVYPVYFLSGLVSNIDKNVLFSLYVVLFFFLTVCLCSKVLTDLAFKSRIRFKGIGNFNLCFLILTIFLTPALFTINGRAIFGIFSSALLMYTLYFWERMPISKKLWLSIFSIFTSTVSSGFTVLSFAILALFVLIKNVNRLNSKSLIILSAFIVMGIFSFDFFWFAIDKNVGFFGGGVSGLINMLNHGLGKFFHGDLVLFFMVFASGVIFIATLLLIVRNVNLFLFILAMSSLVGLFGFTTMAYGIPALVVLLAFSLFYFMKFCR